MRLNKALLICAFLAGCSPAPHKQAAANQAPAPTGHTPSPNAATIIDPPYAFVFHGYVCGSDCGTHQAGYDWAKAHDISDPRDCRGNSEGFIEGCKSFAGVDGPIGAGEPVRDED